LLTASPLLWTLNESQMGMPGGNQDYVSLEFFLPEEDASNEVQDRKPEPEIPRPARHGTADSPQTASGVMHNASQPNRHLALATILTTNACWPDNHALVANRLLATAASDPRGLLLMLGAVVDAFFAGHRYRWRPCDEPRAALAAELVVLGVFCTALAAPVHGL
jgi:hypothetical protein